MDTSIGVDKIEKLDSKGAVENSSKSLIEEARICDIVDRSYRDTSRDTKCLWYTTRVLLHVYNLFPI